MDYYQVLGISRDASQEEIKKNYKKLALQYHPDKNKSPGADKQFSDVTEAYEVLSDPEKRNRYDNPQEEGFFGLHFEDLFGGFGSRQAQHDLHVMASVNLSFFEPTKSNTKTISFNRKISCDVCSGSGGIKSKKCSSCKGSGKSFFSHGNLNIVSHCKQCEGSGKIIQEKCKCDKGFVIKKEEIEVTVPAGVMDGQLIRVQGHGNVCSVSGKTISGDLLLKINIEEHPVMRRNSADVISELEINYEDIILGLNTSVDTVWGKAEISIKPGQDITKPITLYSKGFPRLGRFVESEKGNHHFVLKISIPKTVSQEISDLLVKLRSLRIDKKDK